MLKEGATRVVGRVRHDGGKRTGRAGVNSRGAGRKSDERRKTHRPKARARAPGDSPVLEERVDLGPGANKRPINVG